jgi:hypothetical protein
VCGRVRAGAQVFVVRQGTPLEAAAAPCWVEDRSPATQSYAEWVVALHKAVQSK